MKKLYRVLACYHEMVTSRRLTRGANSHSRRHSGSGDVAFRRRCCMCFGLYGNVDVTVGQIAHLDHDNNNKELGNLAFLCLDHHDQL